MSMVIERLNEHYNLAKKDHNEDNIVGIFLVGSQNYGTDIQTSDVDSKLVITPSLSEIYSDTRGENKTIKIPESADQMSIKDIRCILAEFKKQNINILETLYTDYFIINPLYEESWNKLVDSRDQIVRYNPVQAVKTTKGMAGSHYDRLYDNTGKINPKQVANIVRLEYYLRAYIEQKPYADCLKPIGEQKDLIMSIRNGELGDVSLSIIANASFTNIKTIADAYCSRLDLPLANPKVDEIIDEVCREIVDKGFFAEYARNGEL